MAYTGSQKITINHALVGASDSVNFPFLFSGSYAYLATVANAGDVTSASGYDIIFTSDSAGLTLLNWEIESYDPVTGTVTFWVKVPTVSHTVDTVIYVFYGDAAVVTFQGGAAGSVWDANFGAVYHFGDVLGLPADSTVNANNGVNTGVTAVVGKIDGGGGNFNGTSSVITIPAAASLQTQVITISAWFNPTNFTTTNSIWGSLGSGTGTPEFGAAGTPFLNAQGVAALGSATVPQSPGVWNLLEVTLDGSGNLNFYMNGAPDGTSVVLASPFTYGGQAFTIGQGQPGGSFVNGLLDEVRISNIARSADWILAEYNNQSSPSTFYTLSSTHAISGNAGVAGAAIALSGAASASTTSAADGTYSFAGLAAGAYVVTPTLAGVTFTPTSLNETIVATNITTANLVAQATTFVSTPTVSDNFNRADAPNLGANWTVAGDPIAIVSHLAVSDAVATQGAELYTGLAFTPNQFVAVTFGAFGVAGGSGEVDIFLRTDPTNATGYDIALYNGNQLNIIDLANPTPALLVTTISTAAPGDIFSAQIVGTLLTVFYNGVPVASVTNASTATGSPGIYMADSAGQTLTSVSLFTAGPTTVPIPVSIAPPDGEQGATISVTVTGTNFSTPTLSFSGTGITVNSYSVQNATTITASITIAGGAALGARNVIVTNADAQTGTLAGAFTVGLTISGSVGVAGAGATITLSGAGSATTTADASGNYSFTGLAAGTYFVTAGLTGMAFSPSNQTVVITAANVSGVNFTTFKPRRWTSIIGTNLGTKIIR